MPSLVLPGLASLIGLVIGLVVIVYGVKRFGKSIDDKWSVTHIQTILWTGVILGSYSALSIANGGFLTDIPTNTLILVGISSGTLASTSLIHGLSNGGNNSKPTADADATKMFMGGFLATEKDPAKPSLIKVQMFAWNVVAILLFVTFVGSNLYHAVYSLPDVGTTVSTIIGISNGAHIAAKPVDK